jgi:hypothetical protein
MREAVDWAAHEGGLDFFLSYALCELVDVLNERPRSDWLRAFTDEPRLTRDPAFDAWSAAAAEYLCRKAGIEPPAWVERPEGFMLTADWFPPGRCSEESRTYFRNASPPEFRRRRIFVDAEPLRRA